MIEQSLLVASNLELNEETIIKIVKGKVIFFKRVERPFEGEFTSLQDHNKIDLCLH